jgi:tRNA threonylcarbamoyl adenosine modification protein YeaZ
MIDRFGPQTSPASIISAMPSSSSTSQTSPPSSLAQLAIETTGVSGSIAVLQGDIVYREIKLPDGHRTASSLAPAMKDLLDGFESSGQKIDVVSVAIGPGSFTGLRVGITTAKTFCYARRLPLVAVDSLAAIATSILVTQPDTNEILVGLNAYRRQIFAAAFSRQLLLSPVDPSDPTDANNAVTVMEEEAWLERLNQSSQDVTLAGDEKIFGEFARSARFRERELADAVGVGLLGLRLAKAAQFVDPMEIVPKYFKASSAEEKLRQ